MRVSIDRHNVGPYGSTLPWTENSNFQTFSQFGHQNINEQHFSRIHNDYNNKVALLKLQWYGH